MAEKTVISSSQSKEKEALKSELLRLIREDKMNRDQQFSFFRDTTLATYTETGRQQFIGFREKPQWKDDYQYNVFDPVTRDKVMAIVSKAGGFYEAQFFNTNKRLAGASEAISVILGAFYKDSTRRLNEKEKNKLLMITALTTPKAIWFEGWRNQIRTVKDIEERGEDGKILKVKERKIVHYNGPQGEIIPVEDFIPGSIKERDIQEQPRLTWVTRMQKPTFDRMFPVSKFPEADKVKTHGELIAEDITDFTVRQDLKEKEVEIIRYFNKWKDEFHIIANGVLLTEINSPMPFNHKDYPFVWGGFEELDHGFIYDMPLTIKIMDMQDVDNEVLNLSLDMLWRALNETILVQGGDEMNEDVLYGGGTIDVDNVNNFKKLDWGSGLAFSASNSLLDRVKQSLESASVSAESAGTAGTGRSRTAREVLVAREAAMEIATLFLTNMENMERDKALLRVKNQLDRYKNPIEWERRIGEDKTDEIAKFREITVRDTTLTKNRKGTINVVITNKPRGEEELNQENRTAKETSQIIEVSPDFIRQIEFDVEIVANSSVRRSKVLESAENERFFRTALEVPQILDVRKAGEDWVKSLDKNPEEAMVQQREQEDITGAFEGLGEQPEQRSPALIPEAL